MATLLFGILLFIGCATLINKTEQNIAINSTPNDAIVQINGNGVGKTPWTGLVDRKNLMRVIVKKEGYYPQIINMEGHLSNWFWGNIISIGWGLLGSSTDTISGGAYEYSRSSYHITLEPINKNEISVIESQSKLKRYILANWSDIGSEVVSTPAERVDALREIMGYSNKPLSDFAKMIKIDYLSSKDPDDFAEKMLIISK